MKSGEERWSAASFSVLGGIVAENMSICLFAGKHSITFLTCTERNGKRENTNKQEMFVSTTVKHIPIETQPEKEL